MSKPEVLVDKLFFPEGPSVSENGILFVEQGLGQVSILTGSTRECYARTGGSPNGLALGDERRYYIAQNGGAVGQWHSADPLTPGVQCVGRDRTVSTVARSCDLGQLRAPNDLSFDASGRLWFTDSGQPYDADHRYADGWLCRIDSDGGWGSCQVILNLGPVYPNGVVATGDGRIIWAETYERYLCYLTPGYQRRRVLCRLPEDHFPDGMAVAADGRLFIASTFAHAVSVISPDGDFLGSIRLDDDAVPTNCCFDGGDLIITDFGPEWRTGEDSGRLWRVETDAKGAVPFRGRIVA